MTTINGDLIRGEQVRHISPEMVGAMRGTVLATFLDADCEPVAAVQWAGGSIAVFRLKWLAQAGPVPAIGTAYADPHGVHNINDARRSA